MKNYKLVNKMLVTNIVLAMVMMMVILATTIKVEAKTKSNNLSWYRTMAREIEYRMNIKPIDCSKLTYKMLVNRNGKQIVERVIGRVKNNKKDGAIFNVPKGEKYYNYISYRNVRNAKKGDVIVTYFYYNTKTNAEDDIVKRKDYIISR